LLPDKCISLFIVDDGVQYRLNRCAWIATHI
jgi:hypothetical protein